MSFEHRRPAWTMMAAAVLLAGCAGTGPGTAGTVAFRLATRSGTAPALVGTPDTITAGGDELVLDTVQLVMRELEFKRERDDACDATDGAGRDACEEVSAGPLLLDLPLGVGTEHMITVAVDTGTFDELEFELHKPEDNGNARDRDFLAAHPAFRGVSIRVVGSFNGQPFTYVSDLNAEQEVEFSPPLVVSESGNLDVTLMVDLATWFRASDGSLLAPTLALAGQAFENTVRDNIRRSFRAFEDRDHDGNDDHGRDDGPDGNHSGPGLRGV